MGFCCAQPKKSYRYELYTSDKVFSLVIYESHAQATYCDNAYTGYIAFSEKEIYRKDWEQLVPFAPSEADALEIFMYNFKKE